MKEYHKIETLFERDMQGTKKLIEGKFRNPAVEYLKDCDWIFTEKVDGTNIRIYWNGHKVQIGGRTNNAQIPAPLVARLSELFLTPEAEQLFEQKFGASEVFLHGEGFGGSIQKGSGYNPTQDFILFDVEVGDIFLERENVKEIGMAFDVQVVPIMPFTKLHEAIEFIKTKPVSLCSLSRDKEMEGVVGLPAVRLKDLRGNRIIVKIKTCDFL
jgi:hypothetical protein